MRNYILTLLLSGISTIAFASGDAGCGLGSVIISKNSKGLQLLAMTTNTSFFSQPLGITSGTSNCSSSGIVSNDKMIENYVQVNRQEILNDMAMGSGEKLETLAMLYGCSNNQAVADFKLLTKNEFNLINSNDENNEAWAKNLNKVIVSNKNKIENCTQI